MRSDGAVQLKLLLAIDFILLAVGVFALVQGGGYVLLAVGAIALVSTIVMRRHVNRSGPTGSREAAPPTSEK
jgi:hypothetical protein